MYRAAPIEIPDDAPFKNDALNRRPVVEFLATLVGRLNGPFVLALDAPWGAGKTTLVRMLQATLRKDSHTCVDFNAWETDYATDPLVALVASLQQLPGAKSKATIKKLGGIVSAVARRSVVAGAKIATMGALDIEKEYEKAIADVAGDTAGGLVDSFEKQKSLLQQFKASLEESVPALAKDETKPNILFFVDEIDRCRPSFAVELLERIKHLFDAKNVVFILSLDKPQLEAGIRAVYGSGFDASEYLRRFIDLDYSIPVPSRAHLARALFDRFVFAPLFAARAHSDLRYDSDQLLRYLSALSDAVNLTPRAMERCFARIRVVLDQTETNQYLFPLLVSVLVVLRATNEDLYRHIASGQGDYRDLEKHLGKTPAGRAFVNDREGRILFAELIAASDEQIRSSAIERLKSEAAVTSGGEATAEAKRALGILEFIGYKEARMIHGTVSIRTVARKIDLAGQIDT